MSRRIDLSDELIRRALAVPDEVPTDLAAAIRDAVRSTRPRTYWWTPFRRVFGPFGPSRELRLALVLAALLALATLGAILVGAQRHRAFVGTGTMFHGNPARTGEVVGPGPVTGAVRLWTATLPGPLNNTMPALDAGRLFVADGRGNISVFDATSGATGWTRTLPKPASSPAIAGQDLIVGAGDGVYALDTKTGATRWKVASNAPVASAPGIVDGVAFVGLPDGTLVAIDAASGAVRWRAAVGGPIDRAPAIADGLVMSGGGGGPFAAVDASSGSIAWRRTLGRGQVSTPAVRDGIVYVASGLDDDAAPHVIHAYAERDGSPLWSLSAPTGASLFVGAVDDQFVYAVSLDGFVYALHDGRVVWRFDAGAPIGSVATLAQQVLYVSVSDGSVLALDVASGRQRWRVQMNGGPGTAVVADGRLWAGTDLGELSAFGDPARAQ